VRGASERGRNGWERERVKKKRKYVLFYFEVETKSFFFL